MFVQGAAAVGCSQNPVSGENLLRPVKLRSVTRKPDFPNLAG